MVLPSESACCRRRTITCTQSHKRLLSLGSWISAAVTVLSTGTTLPLSNLSCRALASSILLTASQVSARIVLCKTDFFRAPSPWQPGKDPMRRVDGDLRSGKVRLQS